MNRIYFLCICSGSSRALHWCWIWDWCGRGGCCHHRCGAGSCCCCCCGCSCCCCCCGLVLGSVSLHLIRKVPYLCCPLCLVDLVSTSILTKYLWVLTLVGPTGTSPVLDPLAVLHLDNRHYMLVSLWLEGKSKIFLKQETKIYICLVN